VSNSLQSAEKWWLLYPSQVCGGSDIGNLLITVQILDKKHTSCYNGAVSKEAGVCKTGYNSELVCEEDV
jgi:hypothetical protein